MIVPIYAKLSTIYLDAAKAPFSVVSDSNKNAASVVFIEFILLLNTIN
jgi:hypothetical protein